VPVATPMGAVDLLRLRREHVDRLAATSGAAGEIAAATVVLAWIPRPKGADLKRLIATLADEGIEIQGSAFDFIAVPEGVVVDLKQTDSIRAALPRLTFIEVKTANSARVLPGFKNFFFALTEKEILASDALGSQHVVVLFNKATEEMLYTSVQAILSQSRSTNWQVSVQL
jgi:hypothetical protein